MALRTSITTFGGAVAQLSKKGPHCDRFRQLKSVVLLIVECARGGSLDTPIRAGCRICEATLAPTGLYILRLAACGRYYLDEIQLSPQREISKGICAASPLYTCRMMNLRADQNVPDAILMGYVALHACRLVPCAFAPRGELALCCAMPLVYVPSFCF